jgi:hypothetical protein
LLALGPVTAALYFMNPGGLTSTSIALAFTPFAFNFSHNSIALALSQENCDPGVTLLL